MTVTRPSAWEEMEAAPRVSQYRLANVNTTAKETLRLNFNLQRNYICLAYRYRALPTALRLHRKLLLNILR